MEQMLTITAICAGALLCMVAVHNWSLGVFLRKPERVNLGHGLASIGLLLIGLGLGRLAFLVTI